MTRLAHATPASAAAILFQVYRLVLLSGDAGATVLYFELHDDVSALLQNKLEVEQDKLSLDGAPVLTDSSEELWKTLSNWLDLRRTYTGTASQIRFCIVTNTPQSKAAPVVALLAKEDKTQEDVKACVAAMSALRAAKLKKAAESGKAAAVDEYVEAVMSAAPDELESLVSNTRVVFEKQPYSAAELTELAARLRLTSKEDRNKIVDGLVGWISRCLTDAIVAKRSPEIAIEAFNNELNALKKVHGALRVPTLRPKRSIPPSEIAENHPTGAPTFLTRLDEVDLRATFGPRATEHYCAYKAELLRLSHEGLIVETAGEQASQHYYGALYDRWEAKHLKATTHKGDAIERGKQVYFDTVDVQNAVGLKLGDIPVDGDLYFFEGGLHVLANDERPGFEICWHPERRRKKETP